MKAVGQRAITFSVLFLLFAALYWARGISRIQLPEPSQIEPAPLAAMSAGLGFLPPADQYFAGDGSPLSASKWAATNAGPFTSPFTAGNVANFAVVNGTGTGALITVGGINAIENFTLTPGAGAIGGTTGAITPIAVSTGKTFDAGLQAWSSGPSVGFSLTGAGVFATAGGPFGGGFVLNSGTLVARGTNAMGSAGSLAINGGSIAAAGASRNFSGKYPGGIIVGGNFQIGVLTSVIPISLGGADLTFSDSMMLGPATRTITIGGDGNYIFGGVISGASGAGITVNRLAGTGGAVTLSGVNTYTGNTTISGGALALLALGSIANSPVIEIGSDGIFDVTALTSELTLANGQTLRASAATATGTINTSGARGLMTAPNTPIVFSAFNGSSAPLTVALSGTLTLQSTNPVTVTVARGGIPLSPGDYKLIAKSETAAVSGLPTAVTVNGDGACAGCTSSLALITGELFLHIAGDGTATPTAAATAANTSTNTPTNTLTNTPTNTATKTPTRTATATPTNTSTATPTPTFTPTRTATATPTNTATATITPMFTATVTPTYTPTNTRTATSTPTFTPTATQTSTPGPTSTGTPMGIINGTVSYGNAIGLPFPRFVSNVTITGQGSPTIVTTTAAPGGAAGQYTLMGFGAGAYTVTPAKTSGANSITSFDAAKIAQHVAGTVPLTGNQLIVADVSNNGSISSFDAGQIARYVAALPPFGVTGQWRFTPVNRMYDSVTTELNGEDYTALLMGEVSGNWSNTGARVASSGPWTVNTEGSEPNIVVSLPEVTAATEKEIIVPVNVRGVANKEIISYEFDLEYDPAVIQPHADPVELAGTVSRGLSAVVNAAEPGLLRVVVYGAIPINNDGVLLYLRFDATGEPGSATPLSLKNILFNEGSNPTLAFKISPATGGD
jgi:autotransporter-associated beta strand protein